MLIPIPQDVQHRGSTLLFHLFQNTRNRQSFVCRAVCSDADLGLRVLFKLINHLCSEDLSDTHSETIYLCLTCVVLLLKDDVARGHVLQQIVASRDPPISVEPCNPDTEPIENLYLHTLRVALVHFHAHMRNSGRCAQVCGVEYRFGSG